MVARVVGDHEVSLNGVRFPINGKVRSSIASSYPPSQRRFSTLEWRDHRGGMGATRIGPEGPFTVCADTSWDIRRAGHLMIGGIIDESDPSLNTAGGSGVTLVSELADTLVTTAGNAEIYSFIDGSGWTNQSNDTTGVPVAIKNGNLAGVEYAIISWTTGYSYASAVNSWTNINTDSIAGKSCRAVEFWDNKLWGISLTGELWYVEAIAPSAPADFTQTARVQLDHGETVTGLFKARSRANNDAFILYATTQKRLLAHDWGNGRFTEITDIPFDNSSPSSAQGHSVPSAVFQGKICLAAGRNVIEYDPSNLTVRTIGLNLPDGAPAGLDGRVMCMTANNSELFVGTQAILSGTDTAVVMAWNGIGWRRAWTDTNTLEIVDSIHVGRLSTTNMSAGEGGDVEYLWIGTTSKVHHVLINNSPSLHSTIGSWVGADSSATDNGFNQHVFPTFSDPDHKTIALRLKVQVTGASTSVGVKVFVSFDGAAQIQMTNPEFTTDSIFDATDDRIEGDGTTTFTFPSGEKDRSGTEFKDIQIALELSATTTSKALDVYSVVLEYLAMEEDRESFDFELNFTGSTAKTLRAAFQTAKASATLVELSYRDDAGDTRNYFVKIIGGAGDELTGHEERGSLAVRVETI